MSEKPTPLDDAGFARSAVEVASRVLVLAPFGRDGSEIERTLADAGLKALVCAGMSEMCVHIRQGAGTVLVAAEALSEAARCELSTVLGDQPAWSALPVLLLASQLRSHDAGWQLVRAIEPTTHVILLERPLLTATLISVVKAAVRSRQRQYQVRDELLARQQAELALRHSQQRLELARQAGGVGLFDWDVRAQRIMWTPPVAQLTGSPEGSLEGTFEDWTEPIHAEDLDRIKQSLEEWLHSDRPEACWEYRLRGAEGEYRWVSARARALRDAAGKPERVIGVNSDITERKQVECDLRAFNERLEAEVTRRTSVAARRATDLRRLAAELNEAEHRERSRLAKLLHDDLQQLLLAVRLRLSALLGLPRDQLELQLAKADELLDDCLSTSRNLTRELSPPILHYGTTAELLQWLGEWFRDKHGLHVTVDVGIGPPTLPDHLRGFLFQAARELLLNVVKHSGSLEALVAVTCEVECLVVQVEDGGDHFDVKAVIHRLERPEGFGLFNIQQRLEALGGQLEWNVTAGGGACARLVIPLDQAGVTRTASLELTRAEMSDRPAKKTRSAGTPLRVVVADDHAVVREGFVALLNRQPDFEVISEASDGYQAVQQADALVPDVVVMDVEMPNLNGIEATRRIKHQQPDVVVVGLSLHQEESMARAMIEAGADAYVAKSMPAQEVVTAIRQACLSADCVERERLRRASRA